MEKHTYTIPFFVTSTTYRTRFDWCYRLQSMSLSAKWIRSRDVKLHPECISQYAVVCLFYSFSFHSLTWRWTWQYLAFSTRLIFRGYSAVMGVRLMPLPPGQHRTVTADRWTNGNRCQIKIDCRWFRDVLPVVVAVSRCACVQSLYSMLCEPTNCTTYYYRILQKGCVWPA